MQFTKEIKKDLVIFSISSESGSENNTFTTANDNYLGRSFLMEINQPQTTSHISCNILKHNPF